MLGYKPFSFSDQIMYEQQSFLILFERQLMPPYSTYIKDSQQAFPPLLTLVHFSEVI